MLKNYFMIAWRNISRHKLYTTINVAGLALGICSCIVIYLVAGYDLSFDGFHPGQDRIYRIVGEMKQDNMVLGFMNSPTNDVAGFQTEIPGFDTTAGIHFYGAEIAVPDGDKPAKKFNSDSHQGYGGVSTVITWPGYFDIFKYDWLAGNAKTALNDPYKVVLSEKRAQAYFGNIPPQEMMGKKVIYDDSVQVSVSGIVRDWTEHTDFPYTDFISISTVKNGFLHQQIPTDDWRSLSIHRSMAFVRLAANTSPAEINARFDRFIKEHVKLNPHVSVRMWVQPLTDIHFTPEYNRGDDGDGFRKAYMPVIYALMGMAVFILLIAIINFINLSTAQSIQRAKEVGVRKVLGSSKTKIVYQFLTETGLITLLAVFVSVLLVKPILSIFASFIPPGIEFKPLQPGMLVFLIAVTLLVCLLAGLYPARVLASYVPALNIKGSGGHSGKDGLNLRKALIVFQFTISLTFIIGALVIGKQVRYMNTADKGFNTDAILTIDSWNAAPGKVRELAEEVRHVSGVSRVLMQGNAPMGFRQRGETLRYKGKNELSFQVLEDFGNAFTSFYGIRFVAGRNMLPGDSVREMVINETLSRAMGFTRPADAVGKLLYRADGGKKPFSVSGVVRDYHTGSFQEAIHPTIIVNAPDSTLSSVAIKLTADEKSTRQMKSTLEQIETVCKKTFPDGRFRHYLLNEGISWLYEQERKTAWLMNVTVGITIFISCMVCLAWGCSLRNEKARKSVSVRYWAPALRKS